ncbi:hypothetical protein [Microseira wollei]|uniref:Uncharacterized protein n=1 Tax=Microseira wollei NIES-4236 TaxID=2530354 RepID=A0AAV3X0F7_9CYAN|nr:hypothetical protein [Microseira wollei]GET36137.1 hypothetical protein MiSe_08850 [Microseira wollei NIES-4236]
MGRRRILKSDIHEVETGFIEETRFLLCIGQLMKSIFKVLSFLGEVVCVYALYDEGEMGGDLRFLQATRLYGDLEASTAVRMQS